MKIAAISNAQTQSEKYVFFDTETTGLPANWNAPLTDVKNWPRMVQLGYIVYDNKGEPLEQGSFIVKPVGYIIPEEASNIHRISTDRAIREGMDIESVLSYFRDNLMVGTVTFVGHNVNFDVNILGAEFIRCGYSTTELLSKRRICTMLQGTEICKIPGKIDYKWPTLMELHTHLFNAPFGESHDAFEDVKATARCFWEMKRLHNIK